MCSFWKIAQLSLHTSEFDFNIGEGIADQPVHKTLCTVGEIL